MISQILKVVSLSPITNHAIKEEITSLRAKPIPVPIIASAGRNLENSEKKKSIAVIAIAKLRISRRSEVSTSCFSSLSVFFRIINAEAKNEKSHITKNAIIK